LKVEREGRVTVQPTSPFTASNVGEGQKKSAAAEAAALG